ncbi:uncharacterized protein LOC116735621 [Xiphophorus hellerii]|uniref:uncharacterized protein LOC116735621 n=1 Tax=Xiphophorus hellerii TaxID=8084 RepID=UPI0013B35CA4|nr:uncharacterized protein LOC116735621 [Xiphophorus hellerii]XP_032443521.1 uncharacterized protein LOC116735621 [Xiphophorus hellerii]
MALKRSALLLLASMIVLHCVRSNPLTSAVGLQLPSGSKEKTDKILNFGKESLFLLKDHMESIDSTKLTAVMKGISSFAAFAPVLSSVISMILVFMPEENPVLNEVKKGFAEVNQKLDSLYIKISNLATDVKWHNYASVYSQDERIILNTWKKFSEFMDRRESPSPEETNQHIKAFTSFYERQGTESSVLNFYHYLTVEGMSLSENINDLLKEKFKCDVSVIGRYNLYLSSLFWKGMVLTQFYWKLTDVNTKSKEAEHVQMFKKVSEAQLSAVEFCLNNYKQYLEKDVDEIIKDHSSDEASLAAKVKQALDDKYSWYSWVVVVFDSSQSKNHKLYTEFTFTTDKFVVGISSTVKADMMDVDQVKNIARECFEDKNCEIKVTAQRCSHIWHSKDLDYGIFIPLKKYVEVTQVAYRNQFVEVPEPFHRVKCYWDGYESWISFHYSRHSSVCVTNQCQNNGKCKRLLRSNEWFCECQDGYYGDACDKIINMTMLIMLVGPQLAPTSIIEYKQLLMIGGSISILIFLFVLVLILVLKRKKCLSCCRLNGSSLESEKVVENKVQRMVQFYEMSQSVHFKEISTGKI